MLRVVGRVGPLGEWGPASRPAAGFPAWDANFILGRIYPENRLQERATVADPFDPYREALVMETTTIWPSEFDDLPLVEKGRIEEELHQNPQACSELEYVRTHTGFCRQITVTAADVQRLSA
jgi:hypothetical protein